MVHVEVDGVPVCQSDLKGRGQCVFHYGYEARAEVKNLKHLNPDVADKITVVPGDCLYRLLEEGLITKEQFDKEMETRNANKR